MSVFVIQYQHHLLYTAKTYEEAKNILAIIIYTECKTKCLISYSYNIQPNSFTFDWLTYLDNFDENTTEIVKYNEMYEDRETTFTQMKDLVSKNCDEMRANYFERSVALGHKNIKIIAKLDFYGKVFHITEVRISPLLLEEKEMVYKYPAMLKENDELRKRNAFLECQPYQGPAFFEALKEENDSGLLHKL